MATSQLESLFAQMEFERPYTIAELRALSRMSDSGVRAMCDTLEQGGVLKRGTLIPAKGRQLVTYHSIQRSLPL